MKHKPLFVPLFISILLIPSFSLGQMTQGEIGLAMDQLYKNKSIPITATVGDLWLMRNYIFAKKGYKFKNEDLGNYYRTHFGFKGEYTNVDKSLTELDKELIKLIQAKEIKEKKEAQSVTIKNATFLLRDGKLLVPQTVSAPEISNPAYKYITMDRMSDKVFFINLESSYEFDAVECCGGEGVVRKYLKRFVYYPESEKMVPVPGVLLNQFELVDLLKDKYLFTNGLIFTDSYPGGGGSAPTVYIYDLESFKLLGKVPDLHLNHGMVEIKDSQDAIMEIWTIKPAKYPNVIRGLYLFINGKLIKTGLKVEEKGAWFYAG
ncbi:MAG: YARHG domain-containing protein [Bacteroidia bacterium]|nr:YARHG domain-containing protein [Bacteroidia bacterium]